MKHVKLLIIVAAALAALIATGAAIAYVTTDQADYTPGSTVTISGDNSDGAGFIAGETVLVAVSGPNAYQSSCVANADDAGAWSCQVTLNADDSAVGDYSYTATGLTSGVTQSGTFVDAPPDRCNGDGPPIPNPCHVKRDSLTQQDDCTSTGGSITAWHFVLANYNGTAPASISVVWSSSKKIVVPLSGVQGANADYDTSLSVKPTLRKGDRVMDATVDTSRLTGNIQFNLSHVTCERGTPPPPPAGSLTACKYNDDNANGSHDPSEGPVKGFSLTLKGVSKQFTDGSGCVTWTNLTPGSYAVSETGANKDDPAWFNTDPGPLCLFSGTSDSGIAPCGAVSKKANVVSGSATTIEFGNIQGADKSGEKFYDLNTNGINAHDLSEPGIAGWKVTLAGTDLLGNPVGPLVKLTDGSGNYSFVGLLPGSYKVAETIPASSPTWLPTTATSIAFTLGKGQIESGNDFGNVCLGRGGGLTLGFWSNKNGQALENAADFTDLSNNFHLRNQSGSERDFIGTLSQNKTAFRTWILAANATNMAYMLSAQTAAMELNVNHSFVSGTAIIYAPGVPGGPWLTVNAVIAAAKTELTNNPVTLDGNPNRAVQEAIKNALDRANNNLNFVQPGPCTFSY